MIFGGVQNSQKLWMDTFLWQVLWGYAALTMGFGHSQIPLVKLQSTLQLVSFWRSKYVRLPHGSCDQVLFGHILVFNTWKSIQIISTTQFWSVQVSKTTCPSKTSGDIISCRTRSNRAGGPCCRWRGESSIYQAPQQCFSFWNDGHCHLIHIIGFCRGPRKIVDRGLDFTCFWTHLGCISCWDFADSHGVTTGHSSLAPEGRVCPPWVVPSSKILRRSRNWEESWPKVHAKDGSGWRINKTHERHLN